MNKITIAFQKLLDAMSILSHFFSAVTRFQGNDGKKPSDALVQSSRAMMEQREFKICRVLTTILGIDVLLLATLFVCTLLLKGGAIQILLSGFFTVVLAYVTWEMSHRRVMVSPEALTISKFFKKRSIPWEDITEFDVLALRRRVHFLLTTKSNGFNFFSNAYEDVYECVKIIKERLDEERVTPAVNAILGFPTKNRGDIIAAVVAGVAMALILYFQYFLRS